MSHLGSPEVVCHCGGIGDRVLFAPQSPCPGSSRRKGSHLPYTSVGLLRLQPAHPVGESGKYLQNSMCPIERGEQTPAPVDLRRSWTRWVMVVHQQRPADALEAP